MFHHTGKAKQFISPSQELPSLIDLQCNLQPVDDDEGEEEEDVPLWPFKVGTSDPNVISRSDFCGDHVAAMPFNSISLSGSFV